MSVLVCVCACVPSVCHQDLLRPVSNNIFPLFPHTHTYTHMLFIGAQTLHITENCYQTWYVKPAIRSSYTNLYTSQIRTSAEEERSIPQVLLNLARQDKTKKKELQGLTLSLSPTPPHTLYKVNPVHLPNTYVKLATHTETNRYSS